MVAASCAADCVVLAVASVAMQHGLPGVKNLDSKGHDHVNTIAVSTITVSTITMSTITVSTIKVSTRHRVLLQGGHMRQCLPLMLHYQMDDHTAMLSILTSLRWWCRHLTR